MNFLNWLNDYSGVLQLSTSAVLIGVTAWYVWLTGKMALAAWNTHKLAITPNVLLLPRNSTANRHKHFTLANMGSGTVLIVNAYAWGNVGDRSIDFEVHSLVGKIIPSGSVLRLDGLQTVIYDEIPYTYDELGEITEHSTGLELLTVDLMFHHSPSGAELFHVRSDIDMTATPDDISTRTLIPKPKQQHH